jgi:hypothetical protein
MLRAFHATQEPSGVITVRRVAALAGVSDTFTFTNEAEMRNALRESYAPDDLYLLLHELAKSGCVIFHAESLKLKPAQTG